MGTHALFRFCPAEERKIPIERHPVVYCCCDGYPEAVVPDFQQFLLACRQVPHAQFDDAEWMATHFVVWKAAASHRANWNEDATATLDFGNIYVATPATLIDADYTYTLQLPDDYQGDVRMLCDGQPIDLMAPYPPEE